MKKLNIVSLVLRVIAASILLQTLYFKFTAQPESVYIFSELGVEPWGRIGTGVIELFTGILLLIPSKTIFGAILGLGLMMGAIGSHVFVIGLSVMNDGGKLFTLAIIELVCCLILCFLGRNTIQISSAKHNYH
jgi:putative oxidoreductase